MQLLARLVRVEGVSSGNNAVTLHLIEVFGGGDDQRILRVRFIFLNKGELNCPLNREPKT